MAYKQQKPFNTAHAGTKNGFCLQNVRLGYGIASNYPNAITAWNHAVQHKDRAIPSGRAVPLFYTYKADGHVNVRMPDGRIWSDGTYYTSLDAYLSSHPTVKYLGWGETLNEVRVLEYVPDPKPSSTTGQRLHFSPIGQTATFYPLRGGTFAMKIVDDEGWRVLENQGNRVRVNSRSAGGDCWVYLKYTATGQPIPGRYIK